MRNHIKLKNIRNNHTLIDGANNTPEMRWFGCMMSCGAMIIEGAKRG